jgi:Fic family protein
MLIPPRYRLNEEIVDLLKTIEGSREVIDSISIPAEVEQNIRRQSTLLSSLFSARIEGSELTMEELSNRTSEAQKKAEVFNTLKAMNWINKRKNRDLSMQDIAEIYSVAMEGLSAEAGHFRKEMSATFNAAGIAVYLHPTPGRINGLLKRLVKYINSSRERFVPIKACVAHYSFEKIHPFLDGNGRVGRLILQKILAQGGYGMKGLVAFEEYIDNHRSEYYRALEEPEKDVTDYLIFMLASISEASIKAKEILISKQNVEAIDFLLPRRAEIYRIINDHKTVNFDQIKRRFLKVNPRTLRYDLKKLQEGGYITKLGTTRGVYYRVSKK